MILKGTAEYRPVPAMSAIILAHQFRFTSVKVELASVHGVDEDRSGQ